MHISFGRLVHFFASDQRHNETSQGREFGHAPSRRSTEGQREEAVVADRRMRFRFSGCGIFNRGKTKGRDESDALPNRSTTPRPHARTIASIPAPRTTEAMALETEDRSPPQAAIQSSNRRTHVTRTDVSSPPGMPTESFDEEIMGTVLPEGPDRGTATTVSTPTAPPYNAGMALVRLAKSSDGAVHPKPEDPSLSPTVIRAFSRPFDAASVAESHHTTSAESFDEEISRGILSDEQFRKQLDEAAARPPQEAAPLFKQAIDALCRTDPVPPALLRATIEAMVQCSPTWEKGPVHAEFNQQVLRVFDLTWRRADTVRESFEDENHMGNYSPHAHKPTFKKTRQFFYGTNFGTPPIPHHVVIERNWKVLGEINLAYNCAIPFLENYLIGWADDSKDSWQAIYLALEMPRSLCMHHEYNLYGEYDVPEETMKATIAALEKWRATETTPYRAHVVHNEIYRCRNDLAKLLDLQDKDDEARDERRKAKAIAKTIEEKHSSGEWPKGLIEYWPQFQPVPTVPSVTEESGALIPKIWG